MNVLRVDGVRSGRSNWEGNGGAIKTMKLRPLLFEFPTRLTGATLVLMRYLHPSGMLPRVTAQRRDDSNGGYRPHALQGAQSHEAGYRLVRKHD